MISMQMGFVLLLTMVSVCQGEEKNAAPSEASLTSPPIKTGASTDAQTALTSKGKATSSPSKTILTTEAHQVSSQLPTTGNITTSKPINCASLPSSDYGSWIASGLPLNFTATLQCNPGYEPSEPNQLITCQKNGQWESPTNICQLRNVAYNDTCYPSQCNVTQNVKCMNSTVDGVWRCLCSSPYFTYNSITYKCGPVIPREVYLTIDDGDIHNNSITVTLNVCPNKSYEYSAYIYPDENTTQQAFSCSSEASDENQFVRSNFKGLSPGTLYTFVLVLSVNGVRSHTNRTMTQYTRPETPENVHLSSITETTMTVTWSVDHTPMGRIDGFKICVHSNDTIHTNNATQILGHTTSSYNLSSLIGGTFYSVSVFSLLGNLTSETPQTATECTHPAPPTKGYVSKQEVDCITIKYDITDKYTIIKYNVNKVTSDTIDDRFQVLEIFGLQQGTQYNFSVTSLKCGKYSLTPEIISTFTRPGPPSFSNFSMQTETTLNVTWSPPEGGVDSYRVWLTNQGLERASMETIPTTYHHFTGLTAGTIYTVQVQTIWKNISSKETGKNFSTATTMPDVTFEILKGGIHETNLSIHFDNGCSNDNEKYMYSIYLKNGAHYIGNPYVIKCSNLPSTISFTNLTAGTEYMFDLVLTVDGLHSDSNRTFSQYTRPEAPNNVRLSAINETHMNVTWAFNSLHVGRIDKFNIHVCSNSNSGINKNIQTQDNTTYSYIIDNLIGGTVYTVSVFSVLGNLISESPKTATECTRPGKPVNVTIDGQSQTSLNITWSAPSGQRDGYFVWLSVNDATSVAPNTTVNTTFHQFVGLTVGSNYTVHIRTVWRGLTSDVTNRSTNTAPENVNVTTTGIAKTALNFSVVNPSYDNVYIFNLIDTRTSKSNETHGQAVMFTDLIPGRLYRLVAIATMGGVKSPNPTVVMANTRPDNVTNIVLDEEGTSNTSMAIRWHLPAGDFDNITVNFYCTGSNNGSLNRSFDVLNNSTSIATCPDLDPGTFCKVELQTKSGYQAGETVIQNISKSTKEEAPSSVTILTNASSSRALNITWRIPSIPNGIIRKYRVLVEDKTAACNNTYIVEELKCCVCRAENVSVGEKCKAATFDAFVTRNPNKSTCYTATDIMNTSFSDLVPGRNYTLTVIPYTKCWGPSTVVYITTGEEAPKGPPINIFSSATTDTLRLNWSHPRCEDITGVITNYFIAVNYTKQNCFSVGEPIHNHFNTTSQTLVLNNTEAFTDYTYNIIAATAIGQGPPSPMKCQKTQGKAPSPVRSLTNTTITDTSVDLAWGHPCFPNGVFSSFIVTITNRDTGELRNESSNTTSISIHNLLPYRNYTFGVVQYNEGGLAGNPEYINITTEQAVPHSIKNLEINSTSGSTIAVRWLPPDLYTGVTNYTVNCVDDNFKVETNEAVWGFNSTGLTVKGLRAYWNYSIIIIAATVAGTNNSSAISVQTFQTEPGPIASLALLPETNVTKPRTVTVVWQEPKLEDKNGIITGYVIRYGYNNMNITTISVNASVNKMVVTDLSTGYINFEVAAKTLVGKGIVTYNSTDVLPGAPLKLNESSQPLILQSNQGITDSETQLSIMLPLKSFFCNDTNGKNTRWGLVVAETSRITGNKPYIGDVAGFNTILLSYRKWKDIEKADIIDPYIPTSSDWNPCSQTDTSYRMKRSVSSEITDTTFLIGEDKECNVLDSMGYCNGQLAAGRQYSVRGFVCTSGGCTESEYSRPIWTDPDPTIPIVAGVVSVVVVILVGVVVIVFMKRRQTACFAAKVQRATAVKVTETEATEMTETVTKVHAFKPCSVPLSELSAHVTDMHKDSNLLFADAFVMVKENSPALSSSMAVTQACRPKNRYTNILSFDHSRVKLLPLEDVEGSDFINANYIPGYKSKRAYIATQGPLPSTFDDFWRMIWEQNVGIIVMLTKLVEKGRNKCDMYWPKLNEPVFFGDIVACTTSESTLPDYTLRVIELKLKDQVGIVRQFSFLKWPDMGCPDHPGLLLDFVKAVRNPEFAGRGPMVVHCSAGVGRTGTFIAVDNLLQYVQEYDTVDIYNLVLEMRHNRCNMVQTEDQFIYIYECLKEFINMNIRNEESEDEEPVYENYDENVYENMGFSGS